MMMRRVYVLFFMLLTAMLMQADAAWAKEKYSPLQYEVSCAGSATQGYCLVKVRTVVDKKQIGDAILRRCAVHGVIFRGYGPGQGCTSQPPLAPMQAEQLHQDFFQMFFEPGGDSEVYATLVEGSMQTSRQGKQYVVTGVVSVAKDRLRKDLELAGIVQKLSSGF